jgi:hypothetical protein
VSGVKGAKWGVRNVRTPTPTYRSWNAMHSRCRYPSSANYAKYGGRGITVCERWDGVGGFANFLADMGERPEGCTLDRRDPDGNYEPSNCRWSTVLTQRRTQRNTNLTDAVVVQLRESVDTNADLARRHNLDPSTVSRVRSGKTWL